MENEKIKKTNEGVYQAGSDPFPPNCLKNISAQTYSQKISQEELRSFVKKKVIETWEKLIYWQSVYLEEVRKGGGTMGHKVGSLRNKQVGLKELFEKFRSVTICQKSSGRAMSGKTLFQSR